MKNHEVCRVYLGKTVLVEKKWGQIISFTSLERGNVQSHCKWVMCLNKVFQGEVKVKLI